MEILLVLCGVFYAVLCVFSIVTGLMYAGGKRKLNPLELSDQFMSRYSDPEKLRSFTMKMGWVTFAVGIVQGITSFAILRKGSPVLYGIALGFTLFSLAVTLHRRKLETTSRRCSLTFWNNTRDTHMHAHMRTFIILIHKDTQQQTSITI